MALTKISGEVIQSGIDLSVSSVGIGTEVSISASGINITGVVTATSFSGDGSNLTGLTGIGVTRTLTIGTRAGSQTINAVGTGITLSLRSGVGTANF